MQLSYFRGKINIEIFPTNLDGTLQETSPDQHWEDTHTQETYFSVKDGQSVYLLLKKVGKDISGK